ncbi:MAG TPA: LuxR C-terminal-related transcriptional regulator [Vicinamibacterales bacterium]|nr:LuxR C-terminal-related transcriptional regulator [Vicinamibacterales bacterium]
MSQWTVQLVIGRLLTDGEFRRRFEAGRQACLSGLRDRGFDLSDAEMAALVEVEPQVWSVMAAGIDRRLQQLPSRDANNADCRGGPLTARERHVLKGVFEGLVNKQIAADLGVSEGAVKATLQHLFRKTNVRTRAQLVRVALEASLISKRPQR